MHRTALRLSAFVSVLVLSLLPAAAQMPQAGIPNTRPDSIPDVGFGGFMANSSGGVINGPALIGKVVVQGNPLIWEPITIALSCASGKTNLTTETGGSDNGFAITHVNLPLSQTQDGDIGRQMRQYYEGCVIRAQLAGYRSTADTITEKVLRDNHYLTDLQLTPEENAPGTDISTVNGGPIPAAQAAFQKAHEAWMHRDLNAAKESLTAAVSADPQFAEAWYLLGRIQVLSDLPAAAASFQKAAAADPRFVPPCVWLATIAIAKKNWQEAGTWSGRALALDPPGTPRIWYYNALVDYRLGRNEAARMAAETALAMDPEHTVQDSEDILALTLVDKGDYAGALSHLKNSLTYIPSGPGADLIKRQIAVVEQKAGEAKK